MDVVLDSNVYLSDPWLESQRMRMLWDFIHKIQGNLILPQVVEMEVVAAMERRLLDAAGGITKALVEGEKRGLQDLPEFDSAATAAAAFEGWKANFDRKLRAAQVKRVPITQAAASGAVERATARRAPCERGGEYRDALIWLSILEFGPPRPYESDIAFLSFNTRDFAAQDGRLHPDLAAEAVSADLTLHYHAKLETFLADHAERFAFLTVEWVEERLDLEGVEDLVRAEVMPYPTRLKFRLSSLDDPSFYEPQSMAHLHRLDLTVEDVLVWKFDDEHLEVSISVSGYMEADLECERQSWYPLGRGGIEEFNRFEDEFPRHRTITGYAEFGLELSASVVGTDLQAVSVEELYSV